MESNQKSLPIQLRRIKSQDVHPKQSPAVNQPNRGIEVGHAVWNPFVNTEILILNVKKKEHLFIN